ncbi:protein BREAST CANCER SUSCEPTIBILITY 2 [Citrus sinensis]|uniref:Protein BREAST CANCER SUSCEPTIBILITY 2 n=1 Tax=Citrus sinensis TaxID=2711 RepID=A0ACB8JVV1_CITSI|nr:protein BREAST CANCER SUSCEPTIBILITY 2 [Citrus sinensis]
MSTWQIFSDADNNFKWQVSGRILQPEPNGSPIQPHSSSFRLPSMSDLLLEGHSKLRENGNEGADNVSTPMFKTGSGKAVPLKQSSIEKALSVLGTDNDCGISFAGEEHPRENGFGFSNSLFQTGSGKTVNISSAGLVRAKSLLGLEEGRNDCSFEGLQHARMTSTPRFEVKEGVKGNVFESDTSVLRPSSISKAGFAESRFKNKISSNMMQMEGLNSAPKPPQIKFHTAGGRSLSVSTDALQYARNLLGDPELGTFFHEVDVDQSDLTSFKHRRFDDSSSNKENDVFTSFFHLGTAGTKTASKNFTSPLRLFSNPVRSRINSKNINTSANLIEKFDAVDHDGVSGLNGKIPSIKKPIRSTHGHKAIMDNSVEDDIGSKINSLGRSSGKPLADITNSTSTACANIKQTCEKKRLLRSSISPFKRPRISKFSTPLRTNLSSPNGKFLEVSEMTFWLLIIIPGAPYLRWVSNHYKWIVWKLACYERCYLAKSAGKFLTVFNVLEELKYRYEREVNNGHRSAIKRILEGDALPSSMMVLCISAIHMNCVPKIETHPEAQNGAENSYAAKLELTDGWYSVDAFLDVLLSKHLAAGKLFVGQKLRIWGAILCGWVGPVSPLEASGSISLQLNINGTYRAHWADRLGFCKGFGAPLAFRCIKSNGGPVPRTLVGVTRIYPVLYKERLSDGRSIVRSERMECKVMQLYQHRQSMVVEGIVSEFQRGNKDSHILNDSNSEGAKLFKMLETAAEPEVIMAEMSPEQLTSFATYQAKLEATRQSNMERSIEKALENAGLRERDVTPFMRVRVVGLTGKNYQGKGSSREGIITIWNPAEKQQCELVEGQAYAILGLIPMNSDSNTLYLQARGSTTKWQPLSPLATEHFNEFDIAAFVVHVGDVYEDSQQKKQWVFVTDGSMLELQLEDLSKSLLAISISSPYIDDDSFSPINYNLVGSTVSIMLFL